MNLKNEWVNNLFTILALSSCVFVVVDIAYDERIWELDLFSIKARLQSLGITIAYFYLLNSIFRRIAHFFIEKAKTRRKRTGKNICLFF